MSIIVSYRKHGDELNMGIEIYCKYVDGVNIVIKNNDGVFTIMVIFVLLVIAIDGLVPKGKGWRLQFG